jgi:hypothetical protein
LASQQTKEGCEVIEGTGWHNWQYKLLITSACPTGTNSQSTLFAKGILGITAVDGVPACTALITDKLKTAIATDKLIGHSINGVYID